MVPTLSNKYVFEPSYNDLKFMIQNHNYFCANLHSTGTQIWRICASAWQNISSTNSNFRLRLFTIQQTLLSLYYMWTLLWQTVHSQVLETTC